MYVPIAFAEFHETLAQAFVLLGRRGLDCSSHRRPERRFQIVRPLWYLDYELLAHDYLAVDRKDTPPKQTNLVSVLLGKPLAYLIRALD